MTTRSRLRMHGMGAFVVASLGIFGGVAQAQTQDQIEAARPKAKILRIQESEAPKVDGVLDDAVWSKAPDIGNFRQIEPVYEGMPSERTVVRVAYDSNNLYIAVYCYDSEPDKILATQNNFDGSLVRDDNIKIMIDPDRTRRNAYSFEVNALGGYTDGLIQNNGDFLKNWNTIWGAAGSRTKDGWTAEISIPFRSLSFDPSNTDWGFDIYRWIRRKNEQVRWGLRPVGGNGQDVSLGGTLEGFSGQSQGSGVDLQTYGVLRYGRYESPSRDDALTFRPSGNLYYKVTPALTALLTVNTDFSDTPLDAVQVSTSRFSPVQQETRQFFLQDVAAFEFGGRAFSPGFIGDTVNNGRPFFSRNIGLVSGRPVSIVAGGKLSGSYQGIDIGALTVRTRDPSTKKEEQLSVLRLKTALTPEIQVGSIFTNGDPSGTTENTLYGGDFQYATASILGSGKRFQGAAYYLFTDSNKFGTDDNYGASVLYPNEPWGGELHFKRIGTDFRPALGFTNRRGIEQYDFNGVYRARLKGASIRQWYLQSKNYLITDLSGNLQSRKDDLTFYTELLTGDTLTGKISNMYEDIPTAFTVGSKAVIPAGDYTWTTFNGSASFTTNRPFSGSVEVECCDYYNGSDYHTKVDVSYLPNYTWGFTFTHTMDLIRLPGGDVDIHILSATTTTNFTPRMSLKTTFQYDNISKRFQALAQYRWEYDPGQDVFVAIGETASIESFTNPHYVADNEQFIVRLGHRFQF